MTHCLSLMGHCSPKVTSTSADGIETVSVNLQGDAKLLKTDGWYLYTCCWWSSGDVVLTPNHPRVDMLVGFTQLRTVGEDLVLYLRMQIQQLSVLIRSALAPQILVLFWMLLVMSMYLTLTATTFGNINTGVITASSFVGDGSQITGVIGVGSGFVIQNNGSPLGMAQQSTSVPI